MPNVIVKDKTGKVVKKIKKPYKKGETKRKTVIKVVPKKKKKVTIY